MPAVMRHDVDGAVPFARLGNHGVDLIGIRDVGCHGRGLATRLVDGRSNFFTTLERTGCDQDACAFCSKDTGGCRPRCRARHLSRLLFCLRVCRS